MSRRSNQHGTPHRGDEAGNGSDRSRWEWAGKWRGRWPRLLAGAVPVALVAVGCGTAPSQPSAVRVDRGSVAQTVSATGTLQPVSQERLGFAKGGKLIALLVSVGQPVSAGQVLARIDDFGARADLQIAQARLDRERAQLESLRQGNKARAARDDSDHAHDVLDAMRDRSDTFREANARLLESAQQRLEQDRDALRRMRTVVKADQDRCNRSVSGGGHRYGGYGDYTDLATRGGKGLLLESPLDPKSPSCSRAERGKSQVAAYERRVQEDERGITYSQRRLDIDEASERVALANAKRDASAARHSADNAEDTRYYDIDEQAANVRMAQADVRRAQRQLADTTLFAPTAGVVANINGQVGEFIGGGSGTTALAPGGGVALPDVGAAAAAGSNWNSDGMTPPPGAGSFITLKNVNSYQIVVPFEESDAALVAPNERVQVSFDAVPGLERDGTVAGVAPTGAQIQDVNNYYATILLSQADSRLKGGMTAQVKVIVGGVDNVLIVPTAAVQRAGATGMVEVLQADGTTRRVQVQLGLVGDSTTQVIDGLTEGQQVVVSQPDTDKPAASK